MLIADLAVGPLAPGASVTLPHGLDGPSGPLTPNQVLPDRNTPIVASGITDTDVTFTNTGSQAASATFRCWYFHSIITASPLTTLGWGGSGSSGAPGSESNVVVFRPGGVAAGNVYTTWAAAYAALQAIQGPKVLRFDDSIVTPCVIPAGAYDFLDCTWTGLVRGAPAVFVFVQIDDGAHFTNWCQCEDFLVITYAGNTPLVEVLPTGGNPKFLFLTLTVVLNTSGTGPYFHVQNTGSLIIGLINGPQLPGGTAPIVDMDVGGICQFFAFQAGILGPNTITGAAGSSLTLNSDPMSTLSDVQPGFVPGVTVTYIGMAAKVNYPPAVPASWVGPPPANVQDALDRLAAAVAGLLGGPIP